MKRDKMLNKRMTLVFHNIKEAKPSTKLNVLINRQNDSLIAKFDEIKNKWIQENSKLEINIEDSDMWSYISKEYDDEIILTCPLVMNKLAQLQGKLCSGVKESKGYMNTCKQCDLWFG